MTRQPIEKQTDSITHCLVYKAASSQFDSLCVPFPPQVNWLISLDSVNWLVVAALCGHSSHFVRPRTGVKVSSVNKNQLGNWTAPSPGRDVAF